jgi:hypothetical protein
MKTLKISVTFLAIITVLYSCKKDSTDTVSPTSKTIFSTEFANQSDLDAWIQTSGGQAVIDSGAVKFTNITDCYHFESLNLIPVVKGKTYVLEILEKVNPALEGDPVFCAGNFLIYVVQDSSNLATGSFVLSTSWTHSTMSFKAANSAPIKIRFLIGTTRGAWIDKLELVEE